MTFELEAKSARRLGAALAAMAIHTSLPLSAAEIVGAVGAANGSPTGRIASEAKRVLRPGDDVFFKDHITTRSGGSAQITLLDRSTLNIGENSDVVIDQFVYRPGETGSMHAKLSKGFLRFVGGDISHKGGATVETPTVTIGIRGGIGLIATVKDGTTLAKMPGVPRDFTGGTIVVNGYGTMRVSNSVSETIISRPGFATFVSASGAAIPTPVRFDMGAVVALAKNLGSREGQSGGLSKKAAAQAARVAIDHSASLDVPSMRPAIVPLNGLDYNAVISAGNALARVRSQAQQSLQLVNQLSAVPIMATTGVATQSIPITTPVMTQPVTTPVTPQPVTTPVTTQPVTTPVTTQPVTTPVTTQPVTTPVTTQPVTTPVTTQPVTTPVMTQPVTTPVMTQPVTTPVMTQPVTTPVTTQPVTTPVTTQPIMTPPVTTQTMTGNNGPGLSISTPGGTITIGSQGVSVTTSTTATKSDPIVVTPTHPVSPPVPNMTGSGTLLTGDADAPKAGAGRPGAAPASNGHAGHGSSADGFSHDDHDD